MKGFDRGNVRGFVRGNVRGYVRGMSEAPNGVSTLQYLPT